MVKIFPFYFDSIQIRKKLKGVVHESELEFIESQGNLWDISAYFSVSEEPESTIFVNDTLFKKPFGMYTLKQVIKFSGLAEKFPAFPIIIGDVHPTYNLQSKLLGSGKHVSTYCFCMNGPAKEIFKKIYRAVSEQSLQQLKSDPANQMLYQFGFDSMSPSHWAGLETASQKELEIKFRCTVIEFLLSAEIERTGVIVDVHAGLMGKILNAARKFQ